MLSVTLDAALIARLTPSTFARDIRTQMLDRLRASSKHFISASTLLSEDAPHLARLNSLVLESEVKTLAAANLKERTGRAVANGKRINAVLGSAIASAVKTHEAAKESAKAISDAKARKDALRAAAREMRKAA